MKNYGFWVWRRVGSIPRISLYIQMIKNMKTSKSKFLLVPIILVKGYSASMKSDGDNYLVRK